MILFLDICNHTMASLLKGLPTFKSLPSAIGLPFLSSAEDAQLKFKSGDYGVRRLYTEVSRLLNCSASRLTASLSQSPTSSTGVNSIASSDLPPTYIP